MITQSYKVDMVSRLLWLCLGEDMSKCPRKLCGNVFEGDHCPNCGAYAGPGADPINLRMEKDRKAEILNSETDLRIRVRAEQEKAAKIRASERKKREEAKRAEELMRMLQPVHCTGCGTKMFPSPSTTPLEWSKVRKCNECSGVSRKNGRRRYCRCHGKLMSGKNPYVVTCER